MMRVTWRTMALAIAALTLSIFIAANAHLIYVALRSQPDCVPHQKEPGSGFQAAKSS
ncbi:hypothetical protein [Taklimakanibacter deserti]|uniref:hypothetical protein n=1 Tax=Taklimakanibacter deserti TaxID=2267839 RepID=UPI0013C52D6F